MQHYVLDDFHILYMMAGFLLHAKPIHKIQQ